MKPCPESFDDVTSKYIQMSEYSTESIKSLEGLFKNCHSLSNIDLLGFKTGHIENMSRMFFNCSSLEEIDLDFFNTGYCINMSSMFEGCTALTKLDLSGFSTSNVRDFSKMFKDCKRLKELNLRDFIIDKNASVEGLFDGCDALTEINVNDCDIQTIESLVLSYIKTFGLKRPLPFIFPKCDALETKLHSYWIGNEVAVPLPASNEKELYGFHGNLIKVFGDIQTGDEFFMEVYFPFHCKIGDDFIVEVNPYENGFDVEPYGYLRFKLLDIIVQFKHRAYVKAHFYGVTSVHNMVKSDINCKEVYNYQPPEGEGTPECELRKIVAERKYYSLRNSFGGGDETMEHIVMTDEAGVDHLIIERYNCFETKWICYADKILGPHNLSPFKEFIES